MSATRGFWGNVEKTSESGCWLWTGRLNGAGYGRIRYQGSCQRAHRVSYQMHVGLIPNGLTLDHLCRNTACVNPAHLEAVPHRINVLRGIAPVAINARKTHCVNGHEFTPENTWKRNSWSRGRVCRTCARLRADFYRTLPGRRESARLRSQAYYQRKRA